MNKKIIIVFLFYFFFWNFFYGFSQILKPIEWDFQNDSSKFESDSTINLFFKAYLDKGWYLYSTDMDSARPMVTKFYFNKNSTFELLEEIKPLNRKEKYDSVWGENVTYFNDSALFVQKIKILDFPRNISGTISYQVCSDIDLICVPFETDFTFYKTVDDSKTTDQLLIKTSSFQHDSSLLSFIIFSFLAGILAILTPCVFPMIPITVSFFINNNKKSTLKNGLIYGLSIVGIFTFVGLVLSLLIGPGIANDLLSNWVVNIFFFILFFLFGISLLGFFEISLPSRFLRKVDKQSEQEGTLGVFFMAFTLVLVSFSCIGPLVGGILVQSASGFAMKPVLGMFSFSIAFALPFTFLAIFPNQINKIPKSGKWMESIKKVIGFLVIAYAFKFLSVIDKAYHFNMLDRDRFLFIWAMIFLSMSLSFSGLFSYVFNKKNSNTFLEKTVGAFSFILTLYLISGFFGNRLKNFSAYLPPPKSTYIDISSLQRIPFYTNNRLSQFNDDIKYSTLFKFPHDLNGFFDYKEALSFAKEVNKPLLLDFTGHGCVNCRDIESRVWSDEGIRKILNNDYVLVSLYVDDKTILPEQDWYISDYDNKVKKSIGKQNADLQITKFNNNAQPFYIIIDPYSEQNINNPFGYDLSIENNKNFLINGLSKYYEK